MPGQRRRAESEFEQTQQQKGTQTVTLSSLTGGFNDYTNPELLSPQFWAFPSAQVYSGLHGTIRRARWAPVANTSFFGTTGTRITSMYSFDPVEATFPFVVMENGNLTNPLPGAGPIQILQYGNNTSAAFTSIPTIPVSLLLGPYMRFSPTPAMILQTNGLARSKMFYEGGDDFSWNFWGIDAPDASPEIFLSAGSLATINSGFASRTSNIATLTANSALPGNFVVGNWVNVVLTGDTSFNTPAGVAFQLTNVATPNFSYANIGPNVSGSSTGGTATVQITKTVGRSYQYAWEDFDTGHVSAPSPASQYVAYSNQTGTIDCVQPGTVTTVHGSAVINGTNTFFTSAWIGRQMWVESAGNIGGSSGVGWIASVQGPTQLTLNGPAQSAQTNKRFQIFDEFQLTNVRLYATGDGGSVYLLIARNLWNQFATTVAGAGLEFIDTANSEPPNPPFTNEISQSQNIPPPIGSFLQDYQGRVLVYGVTGALQSFFYSNIELTVVGQPPESFASLNEVTLPVGEAQINGMANLPTGCLMWSSKQDMFKLTGTLTDNTIANAQQLGAAIQRLPYRIGCASPYATTVTNLGAFWLSSDREVWLFTDHYAPKNIGKPIQNLLNQATRIQFARMKNYKSGDRNWLALAITVGSGSFNNMLCLLDLDLLSSNGQPSFFTFDMATNQPSWYIYNTNCESIEPAFDANSVNHLLAGDIDLITDLDWNDGYFTVGVEQSIPRPQLTLHALGNEDPEMIKTGRWMRVTTNQLPKNLASQGWNWGILCYDDDKYVLGINGQLVQLVPGVNSPSPIVHLEYSPSIFRFGGLKPVKGRRFQVQTNFPSGPGFYELRGFQISYDPIVGR